MGSFVIEFAALDAMPASVFLVLQQIQNGLWNNSTFFMNGPHVAMAQPADDTNDDDTNNNLQKMHNLGLARLPFQEYNDRYPHEPYTLGLAGRTLPGPNFFVNKGNNSQTM